MGRRSQPTYEGLKRPARWCGEGGRAGSQPTYEGLKHDEKALKMLREESSQPTYEGLKRGDADGAAVWAEAFPAYL